MRRILLFSILLVSMTGIFGCSNNKNETTSTIDEFKETENNISTQEGTEIVSTEYVDEEIAQIYREVLKSERTFISVNENNKELLLCDYNYYQGTYVENLLKTSFCFVDIDDDNNYEIVVSISTEEDYPMANGLLLVCQGEEVYGYSLPQWICMRGDNVFGWHNTFMNETEEVDYHGCAKVQIENNILKLTYLFPEPNTEEERWLIENNCLTINDGIEYVGEEFSLYFSASSKREYGHDLLDRVVDKYVR